MEDAASEGMPHVEAPEEVRRLVERYERDRSALREMKEAELKVQFIEPLFKALGWDVHNENGAAPQYRDVIHQDSLKIGEGTKAPDYCFTLSGSRKFFVEAKPSSVNIGVDKDSAFQLRRYLYSAKLPLSILTNFEELYVYEPARKPKKDDDPDVARVRRFTFRQYVDEWGAINGILSKEAVIQGAFDRFAEDAASKRGTQKVDDAFLEDIEGWREALARNLALRNAWRSPEQLGLAVQATIDRLIFLRMCEDRGLEPYGQLRDVAEHESVYTGLTTIFRDADTRYNSGLFHFRREKGRRTEPDELTLGLIIDDDVLRRIIRGLYYPECPYEFSVLPLEILGSAYERFLGKVIRLTAGQHAKVEEKPEVKKAGGVFYTPRYIVDHIVENTVGRLCKGRTPKEVARLRILDPACGSGSFLLGAYRYLLDWHLHYYASPKSNPGRLKDKVWRDRDGQWHLTIAERKRILLDNIFGVDIDPQAVEVTKLSLLLKVLEGERTEMQTQLQHFIPSLQRRALPDLDANIRCGNSLIGTRYVIDHPDVIDEDRRRLNAFDYETEFPEVVAAGGFDAVIGNPPYIRIQVMQEWAPLEVEHYKERYASASKGNYDIYVVFVERALQLLNPRGRMGFILPHKFFQAQYGRPLRKLVADGRYLAGVVHFGDQQVFEGATNYTCLLFLSKAGSKKFAITRVRDLAAWRARAEAGGRGRLPAGAATDGELGADSVTEDEWNFVVGPEAALFEKLRKMPMKLGDVADIYVGLQTSADDVFIMDLVEETPTTLRLKSKALEKEWTFEKGLFYPLVSGTDVGRYRKLPERQYILFPYRVDGEEVELIDIKIISTTYPKTAAYLLENKVRLEGRERGKSKGPSWYGYIYLKNMTRQSNVKLCVPRLVETLNAAFDIDGNHFLDNVDVGGLTLNSEYQQQGLIFILALINSRLLRWYFPFVSATFRGGWRSANRQFLSQLPIRTIDFSSLADRARHDRMVALVERMLGLHRQLAAAATPHDREGVQRVIEATDREIDALVYELYALTEEEIRIVEEGTGSG